jgi:hypothetical protein
MTHQEAIIKCVAAVLALDDDSVTAFRRGNPFDKLLRSYDEFNAEGQPLYKNERARKHYMMSVRAYESGLPVKELYGEHRIPLSVVIARLLGSDRTVASIRRILEENAVILVTKEEAQLIDRAVNKGGLGLKQSLPPDGRCRLEVARIEIAWETAANHL